jgi:hypothetical protein
VGGIEGATRERKGEREDRIRGRWEEEKKEERRKGGVGLQGVGRSNTMRELWGRGRK